MSNVSHYAILDAARLFRNLIRNADEETIDKAYQVLANNANDSEFGQTRRTSSRYLHRHPGRAKAAQNDLRIRPIFASHTRCCRPRLRAEVRIETGQLHTDDRRHW